MSSTRFDETRDYGFADKALALRERAGLTQRELAVLLAVSGRAIQAWEAGLSYPGADHLTRLIALYVERGAFAAGREEDEAVALCEAVRAHASRRTVPFDHGWFASLRRADGASVPPPGSSPLPPRRYDWGEAPATPVVQGRVEELATLTRWVRDERCRVVEVLGAGGIGKTTLAAQVAHDLEPEFAAVYWRSLRNAPPVEEWLASAIAALSMEQATIPAGLDARLGLLLELLRAQRALLALDNLETVLEPGAPEVSYRAGYEGYGVALHRLAEGAHEGCLLLTSREQPLPADEAAVRALRLQGLGVEESRALLDSQALQGDDVAWRALVERYRGNPLALRVVGETIAMVFGGDLAAFLAQDTAVFGGIQQLLEAQVARLSALERAVLTWLAVEREPVAFAEIVADLGSGVARGEVVEAVEALRRRSLLEWGTGGAFTLQPVVLEDATRRLVEDLAREIVAGEPALLVRQALLKATAKDYVRRSQERLIARPLLERLRGGLGSAEAVERRLLALLGTWRGRPAGEQGYGPGNLLNLLRLLRGDLRGLDFSRLTIRQAYLQGVEARDASLAGAHLSEAILSEAFTYLTAVALSADGAYLAMGTSTGEVQLRRVADRTLLMAVQGHSGPSMGVALSVDGRTVASASWDETVKLWEAPGGRLLATLRGHTGRVWRVALSGDGRLVASSGVDKTVRLWEAPNGRLLATLEGHTGAVRGVALSGDGHTAASGGADGTVRLWEAPSGELRAILHGHIGAIWSVALSSDGRTVASGGADGMVLLWAAPSGRLQATLRGHSGGVQGVALSGDGRLVASGGVDGMVRLWEASHGEPLATLEGHSGMVRAVALSADGRLVASASWDETIRLWEAPSGRPLATVRGHLGGVWGVALSADGRTVVSGGLDGTVRLWEAPSGRLLATLEGHTGGVRAVALSADGRLVASASWDETVRLWEAPSGRPLAILRGHAGLVWGVALSGDGLLLASGSYDGTVTLWDPYSASSDGARPRTLRGDRRYERLDITGLTGVTDAQRGALVDLGAVEQGPAPAVPPPPAAVAHPPPTALALTAAPAREPAVARPPTNLPPDHTSFIGRAADVAALALALDPATPAGARLLTLSGVAGSGKTRLALAAVEAVRDRYEAGVWLVELAPLPANPSPDPTAVTGVALTALDLREQPGQDLLDTLAGHLQARRLLLVFDNCEHVVAACAAVAARLLGTCPDLRVLATSQLPLGTAGETIWRVDTLTIPDPVAGTPTEATLRLLGQSDAVRLFVERARAVQPRFVLSAENAATVAAICRRLDGLPLAIELAAARLHVLSVDDALARLDDRFRLLRRGGRIAVDRHQTLQATLDWSYGLLDSVEQALLRRLAVFTGGWEVAAAEAVCAGEEVAAEAVLELLDELLDRSLVYVYDVKDVPRYGLLETVRQYGAQQLERAGETAVIQNRRLRWTVTLAEQAAPALQGPEQAAWLARLAREHDNLRAALQSALDRGESALGLRVAGGLGKFWLRGGHQREGRRWLAALLALAPDEDDAAAVAARATALEGAAGLAEDAHDFAGATALYEQSGALRRALGQEEPATKLINAGMEARAHGDYARATTLLEECLAQYRGLESRERAIHGNLGPLISFAYRYTCLALVLTEQGAYARATALCEECLAMTRELGDVEGSGVALLSLADVARDQGDAARVRAYGEESLALFQELGHPWAIGFSLNDLAQAAYLDGDLPLAARRAEESATIFRGMQAGPSLAEALVTLGRVRGAQGAAADARGRLSEALALTRVAGPRVVVVAALGELGVLAVGQGQARQGARLLGAAARMRQEMGTPVRPADRTAIEGALAAARTSLGDAAFADAWSAGQTLSVEQLVAQAAAEDGVVAPERADGD